MRITTPGLISRIDRRQAAFVIAVVATTAIAGFIRLRSVKAGIPYPTYVDEHFVLEASAHQIANRSWDTGWSWYPSLQADLTTAIAGAFALFGVDGIREGARITLDSPYAEVVEPWQLIVAGRLVVIAFSTATVALVALLGARLAGRRVGVVAAGFAAVMPALVRRGSIVITDTPAAFLALAVIYGATRISDAERPRRWAIVTGIATGLAVTSKYTAGFAAISVPIVLAVRRDLPVRERITSCLAAGLAAIATATAVMPRLVFRTDEVINALQRTQAVYARRSGSGRYINELLHRQEVGVVITGLAVIGIIVLLRSRANRPIVIAYLAFAAVSMGMLLRSEFQPFRNALPLVPFLCIAAATALVEAIRVVVRVDRHGALIRSACCIALALAMCLSTYRHEVRPSVQANRARVDSRVSARRWLEANVQADDRVIVAEEIAFIPSELARIPGQVQVRSQFEPLDAHDADFVVRSGLGGLPGSWDNGSGQLVITTYGSLLASCPSNWSSPEPRPSDCPTSPAPGGWHANRVLIEIIGPPTPAGTANPSSPGTRQP